MALQAAVPLANLSIASAGTFVPACIAEQCFAEAKAVATDAFSGALIKCASENFAPCANDAWDCLGDINCRAAITCAPTVVEACSADFWKMITEPAEREKLTCLLACMKDGTVDVECAAKSCGKAALGCLTDATCKEALECAPKAVSKCAKPAFECLFGKDDVCRENLKCLGHGISECGGPAVNLLTDTKIADLVTCAGTKCPHPVHPVVHGAEVSKARLTTQHALPVTAVDTHAVPGSTAEQLLCMASTCHSEVLNIFKDEDTKSLLHCALESDAAQTCSSIWQCFGDASCNQALQCWSEPLKACGQSVWHLLTDDAERARLQHATTCMQQCGHDNQDNFVDGMFCLLDKCGQDVVDCWKDDLCRAAAQCMPAVAAECAMPTVDAYVHQELFTNSVKCVGRGLEFCGQAAVGMLQDQNIAKAVNCAAQCTRPAMYPMPTSPPSPAPAPTPSPVTPTPVPTSPAPVSASCDDDAQCPADSPSCVATPGLLKPVRAALMHLLPRGLKDVMQHLPLIDNLVKGSCAGATSPMTMVV